MAADSVSRDTGGASSGSAIPRNGFDKLAQPYRWLEYLSFGALLWRTRTAFLDRIGGKRNALILGDGDGRFTAALLRRNRAVRVHAVDVSGAMLAQLRRRARRHGATSRLHTLEADATQTLPEGRFDLVCTHFFLDCLHDAQCAALAARVAEQMEPAASWVVSEFAVPQGWLNWPARALVRSLYAAFALLTGLRVRCLPDHAAALRAAALECTEVQTRLGGILRAELWRLRQDGGSSPPASRIQSGMSDLSSLSSVPGSVDDGVAGANYPPSTDDEILPSIPGDPVPNPEPEQPSLGLPDPGIYEGTGGTASLESE